MDIFNFGGAQYSYKHKMVLRGMDYYYVFENVQTHHLIYLYCFPEK